MRKKKGAGTSKGTLDHTVNATTGNVQQCPLIAE